MRAQRCWSLGILGEGGLERTLLDYRGRLCVGRLHDKARKESAGPAPRPLSSWSRHPFNVPCRTHLYGDIYSSPGIPLRLKQLLICSNLAMADMPDQLFGHAIAVSLQGLGCWEIGLRPHVHPWTHGIFCRHAHRHFQPARLASSGAPPASACEAVTAPLNGNETL